LRELHALRGALEGLAAEFAATRVTARDLHELRGLLARMSSAASGGDRELCEQLDQDFHLRIITVSGLLRVSAIAQGVWAQLRLQRSLGPIPATVMVAALGEHLEIVCALEDGDAQRAREQVQQHSRQCGERLISAMDGEPGAADDQA
jgi:DNA-binding GntR family transcriptional regulator